MLQKNYLTLTSILLSFVLVVSQARGEWTRHNSGVWDHLYSVFFLNADYGFAVGWGASEGAVILKTVDGGEEWTSTEWERGSLLFSITFLDSLHGFAVGYDASASKGILLETINGGEEWMRFIFQETFGVYVVQFPSTEVGYVCGYQGAIFKTSDGGWSWDILNTGTNTVVFRKMHFVDDEIGYAAGGTSFNNTNMIYQTTDGGDNWEMVKNFGNSLVIGGIHFFNADNGVIAGNDGSEAVYRTTDGGENWERTYSGNGRQVLQGVYFNENSGWAFGDAGRIHRSVDAGESWELDEEVRNVYLWLDAWEGDGVAYCVGTDGAIFKNVLEDDAAPWHSSDSPSAFRLYQNYPNPFNPTTTIGFELEKKGLVSMHIFDVYGKQVRSVIKGELNSGSHSISFDGTGLTPGTYYYQLKTGDGEAMQKMILLK